MRKFSILILGILLSINTIFAASYTIPNYNPSIYNTQSNLNTLNSSKLSEIEQVLFGRTYENQNSNTRLNRLEKSIFKKTYPNVSFEQRMNNLLMNYNNNFSTLTNKNKKIDNLINNLNGRFYGTPTGVTPPVYPYYHTNTDWGRQTDYYGNRGWVRKNRNVGSGMSIKILD